MKYVISSLLLFALTGLTPGASAQSGAGMIPPHKFELIPYAGYEFTFSQDFVANGTYGNIDIKDNWVFGGALDYIIDPFTHFTLMYQLNSSTAELNYTGAPKFDAGSAKVSYIQAGVMRGLPRGKIFPYAGMTLGASHFNLELGPDTWKFAVIPSLGAKIYPGGRIGLRVQASLPLSITQGGVGVGCGGGGCSPSFGGTGITQLDFTAGLIILMGQ